MHWFKRVVKIFFGIILVFLIILIALFLIRFFSPREIDDVTPGISCSEELLEKSDVLWVIPLFDNESIANNASWCAYIKGLNKSLGLHGVEHRFNEFGTDRDEHYVQRGIDAFSFCFGFKPEMFKPPQLNISERNKELIERIGLELKGEVNQILHKVYHCDDSGSFSNKWIEVF